MKRINHRLSELFQNIPQDAHSYMELSKINCPYPLIEQATADVLRLTSQIKEYNRIIPLLASKHQNQIVLLAGYRQYYAAKLMRLTECKIQVCELSREQELQIAFEDLQYEALRAKLIQSYAQTTCNTATEIAKTLSVSAAYVERMLAAPVETDVLYHLRKIAE